MDRNTNINLLENLERVSSGVRESGLESDKLAPLTQYVSELMSFLDISHMQAILFSVLAGQSLQGVASLGSVAKQLNCSVLKLITYMDELDGLEKKGYIKKSLFRRGRKNSYSDKGYAVPDRVIEAIRSGDSSLLTAPMKFDLAGFLETIADMVNEREQHNLSTDVLFNDCKSLITKNRHLSFVKFVDDRLNEVSSKITLFALAYGKLKGLENVSTNSFAAALFDDLGRQIEFTRGINSGTGELISAAYIDHFDTGFNNEHMIYLTKKVMMMLYISFPGLKTQAKKPDGIIDHKGIKEQKLYFRGKTAEDLSKLEKVIKPYSFRRYSKELKSNKLNPGITAIFHGAPGTGKTEVVYQLARKAGRDLMMVDLSKTKSKWFGESEKVVKKIFDDYREFARTSPLEPILFINEGDGLFSHRLNLEEGGTSADFAVNTIQNVLLQELEDFEGIFITTTNLASNLDRAFERRLTFKIEFSLPDMQTRKRIWQSKIPELTTKQAGELASRFSMSGGDIDIAVRKLLLQRVISRKTDIYTAILDSCSSSGGFAKNKKIGFSSAP